MGRAHTEMDRELSKDMFKKIEVDLPAEMFLADNGTKSLNTGLHMVFLDNNNKLRCRTQHTPQVNSCYTTKMTQCSQSSVGNRYINATFVQMHLEPQETPTFANLTRLGPLQRAITWKLVRAHVFKINS